LSCGREPMTSQEQASAGVQSAPTALLHPRKDVMSRVGVPGAREVVGWRAGGRAFVSNGIGRRARLQPARPAVEQKAPTADQRIGSVGG
jgi:hypothetical protein